MATKVQAKKRIRTAKPKAEKARGQTEVTFRAEEAVLEAAATTVDYVRGYDDNTLFPPFLEEGSDGSAVQALQILLLREGFTGISKKKPLIADGDWGPVTTAGVKWLQRNILVLTGKKVDGKFGPETRAAFADIIGPDLNAIPAVEGTCTRWVVDGVEQKYTWPPDVADGEDWRIPLMKQLGLAQKEEDAEEPEVDSDSEDDLDNQEPADEELVEEPEDKDDEDPDDLTDDSGKPPEDEDETVNEERSRLDDDD